MGAMRYGFGMKHSLQVTPIDILQVVEWNPPPQAEAVENLVY